MATNLSLSKHGPRELRRKAMVPARVRTGAQWGDACILNVSSRGLMIRSGQTILKGSTLVIARGDHLIVGRVVWADRDRCGLVSDERLPVEEILSVAQSRALQVIATNGVIHDRRRNPRGVKPEARLRGRALEFFAVGAIAALLAYGMQELARRALTAPLASVSAALDG